MQGGYMVNNNGNRIAIFGATGHIAQSLIHGLALNGGCELFLFARNEEKMKNTLVSLPELQRVQVHTPGFSDFDQHDYDVIINCIGIGNPQELIRKPDLVFRITEDYDNLILRYLHKHSSTLYINFSSGAAFGSDFHNPASVAKLASYEINQLSTQDFYGITKLNMEAKHRSLREYRIIDLRIFGFFSSFIDLSSKFLLTDIVAAIEAGNPLLTSPHNIIRDYVHPSDLDTLIQLCIRCSAINRAFDVYSLKPIGKFDLLDYFSEHHGLHYQIEDKENLQSATGSKTNYYSENRSGEEIGYRPAYRSLQSIMDGYRLLRSKRKGKTH
jgi:nucleoside-diphosphate-sugar epimerase